MIRDQVIQQYFNIKLILPKETSIRRLPMKKECKIDLLNWGKIISTFIKGLKTLMSFL